MSDVLDDPDRYRHPAELTDIAMACRPRARPDVTSLALAGGTFLWPPAREPYLVRLLAEAVWPHLDGSSTLGELAEDLADALGAPLGPVRDYLTSLAAELVAAGLADGLDPLVEAWPEHHPPLPAPDAPRGQFEEVRDGVRYLVTEIDVNRREIGDLVGGQASVAELLPPDSCAGQRLQLDRPAEVVTLELGGRRLAVRTSDEELVAWLRDAPAHVPDARPRGPIVVFLSTHGEPESRRFVVQDQDGLIVTNTVDRDEVRQVILGLLVTELDVPSLEGHHELRVHLLHRGRSAMLAPLGALARPRGLHRQLARRGVVMAPTPRVFLATDGTTAAVPRLASLTPDAEIVWDHYDLRGAWARGNRFEEDVELAQELAVLLHDSRARSAEAREEIVHGMTHLLQHGEVVISHRTDLNTRRTTDEIVRALPVG